MHHNYLFLFHVQYGVKKLNQQLAVNKIKSEIVDVPRKLSTECELGVVACFETPQEYLQYINEQIREVYEFINHDYTSVWQDLD